MFSSLISAQGGVLSSLAPDAARASETASTAAAGAREPRIRIAATRPSAALTARGAQLGRCRERYETQTPVKTAAYAIVGEVNNAYNDGTRVNFSHAREQTADTDFGVAVSDDAGDTFGIVGQNHSGDSGTLTFPPVQRRWARQLRTKFEFTREAVRTDSCAVWSIYIRATGWLLGTDSATKQKGTLDRCDSHWVGGNASTAVFIRSSNRAVRWTHGAAAFGVWLTTQSGFSRNVTINYTFGGPANKKHYLCGPDGRQDPSISGRIFSGARR